MNKVPRGFRDLYGEESNKFSFFINYMMNIAGKYGCKEISTTIVEDYSLFNKNMSNSSVVVDKEIFMLEKEGLCLRPEFTASIVRFLTSNNQSKSRLVYAGPCFRGERPQSGRYRQFYQFGVEMAGGSIYDIFDCFSILIEGIKILNKKPIIYINHMGNADTRKKYEDALYEYFKDKQLSKISKLRFEERRFLRILDSKEIEDQDIIKFAPKLYDYLNNTDKKILDDIIIFMEKNKVICKINQNLVRGLDYYSGIIFEVIDEESNLALAGGGEYNNLLEINNKYINCIGFAFGVDRIVKFIDIRHKQTLLLVSNSIDKIKGILDDLRAKNICIIPYIINFEDYKKVSSISQQYKCNFSLILYENDVRINGDGFNKNITYVDLQRNNYEILNFMV